LKIGVLYSGGKDSTYAAYTALTEGHILACFITMLPRSPESFLFHYPNVAWTVLQAEAVEIPVLRVETEGVKDKEATDLVKALGEAKERFGIEGVYTGGVASGYQKGWFERVCTSLGLRCIAPFWLAEPEEYMRSIIRSRFKVMVVGVSAAGLDEGWLGRIVDDRVVDELKALNRRFGVHIAFEGGEAETFVLDCPLFKKRVEVLRAEKHWMGEYGYLEIKEARLVEKS